MTEPRAPRSVKISDDERGGWSSDRPRGNRPPKPVDISTRQRVLQPVFRMRYSPGSLVVLIANDAEEIVRFAGRALEDKGALLTVGRVRSLLVGKVPEDQIDARAEELLDKAVMQRLAKGDSVVVGTTDFTPERREAWVRAAHAARRPRHVMLLEPARADVAEDARAALNELRNALDAGRLGEEGVQTGLRLGGNAIAELKKIVFRPPPKDD